MKTLRFMGVGPDEAVRGRVYGCEPDRDEGERRGFLAALAAEGVLDCPAYDGWIRSLQARGWVPKEPEFEAAPESGRHARWRLTDIGRQEWDRRKGIET